MVKMPRTESAAACCPPPVAPDDATASPNDTDSGSVAAAAAKGSRAVQGSAGQCDACEAGPSSQGLSRQGKEWVGCWRHRKGG